jgi:hypothetical protein
MPTIFSSAQKIRKQKAQHIDKQQVPMHNLNVPTNLRSNFFRIPPPTMHPSRALGTVTIPGKEFI